MIKRTFSLLPLVNYLQVDLKLHCHHVTVTVIVGRILINGLKDADYEIYGKDIDGTYLPDMDEALTEISSHARGKGPNFHSLLTQ